MLVFSGLPSRPKGPLEIIKVSYDYVDLEWKAPESDGGTPIKKYTIDYRSASRLCWLKGINVEANVNVCRILGLVEGTEYYFRVIAVNEEGESPPLETTETATPTREIG